MTSLTVPVEQLEGNALDYFVAKAAGLEINERLLQSTGNVLTPSFLRDIVPEHPNSWQRFLPSRTWGHAGPIIERERIAVLPYYQGGKWNAGVNIPTGGDDYTECNADGKTPLIAAMRCYVASKFGDTVTIPSELAHLWEGEK